MLQVPVLLAASVIGSCISAALARPYPDLATNGTFDYVIVGAGPGGLVMANRLSEDPRISVAVIEAGTWAEDVVGNRSEVPAYDSSFLVTSLNATPSGVDWGFVTAPQAGINNRVLRYPRGKVLGGSSNLNAMAWEVSSRGAHDKWADEVGDSSWRFDNVAQFYHKASNFTPPRDTRLANATPSYDPALLSTGGPLDITYPAYAYSFTTWVGVALEGIGIKKTDSFLSGALDGSAWHVSTVNQTNGFRASADRAYLRPYWQRPNLNVFNGTLAERIIFNQDKVATGVRVTSAGASFLLRAKREVIVSAGVFQSPQLLQVSGIGPAALLRKHGVPVIADRPGVGKNLDDQVAIGVGYRVNVPTGSNLESGDNAAGEVKEFRNNATGRLTNPGGEYGGYEKIPGDLRAKFSNSTLQTLAKFPADWPEIEYLALPSFVGDLETTSAPTDSFSYGTLLATFMTSTSRGTVEITSSRMADPPRIDPKYLSTKNDIELAIAMFKRLRQAWTTPALKANLTIGAEYYPGESVQTDAEIEHLIRSTVIPLSHATATCKMGKEDDGLAVVNPHGKVYGVKNVRVVDASAFPFLPPGAAPQAVVYMLAEKIATDVKRGY